MPCCPGTTMPPSPATTALGERAECTLWPRRYRGGGCVRGVDPARVVRAVGPRRHDHLRVRGGVAGPDSGDSALPALPMGDDGVLPRVPGRAHQGWPAAVHHRRRAPCVAQRQHRRLQPRGRPRGGGQDAVPGAADEMAAGSAPARPHRAGGSPAAQRPAAVLPAVVPWRPLLPVAGGDVPWMLRPRQHALPHHGRRDGHDAGEARAGGGHVRP